MEEKSIVNDVLETVKLELKNYEDAIIETSNLELRQTFQNLRNSSENFQYELFKLAESKGYYNAPQNASQNDITKLKTEVGNF